MTNNNESQLIGVPYAYVIPETGACVCTVCEQEISEDYNENGEKLTNNYAEHYLREHCKES